MLPKQIKSTGLSSASSQALSSLEAKAASWSRGTPESLTARPTSAPTSAPSQIPTPYPTPLPSVAPTAYPSILIIPEDKLSISAIKPADGTTSLYLVNLEKTDQIWNVKVVNGSVPSGAQKR